MYLLLLGIIAVGAGLLLVYYSTKGKKDNKKKQTKNWDPEDKGKVIYLFDEENDDGEKVVDVESKDIKEEKTAEPVAKQPAPKDETQKDD